MQRGQKAEGKDNIRFPFLAAVPPAVKAAVHYPAAHHPLPPQVSAFHTCLSSASPGPAELVIRKALLFELLPLTWAVHQDCAQSNPLAVTLTWEGESLQLGVVISSWSG